MRFIQILAVLSVFQTSLGFAHFDVWNDFDNADPINCSTYSETDRIQVMQILPTDRREADFLIDKGSLSEVLKEKYNLDGHSLAAAAPSSISCKMVPYRSFFSCSTLSNWKRNTIEANIVGSVTTASVRIKSFGGEHVVHLGCRS